MRSPTNFLKKKQKSFTRNPQKKQAEVTLFDIRPQGNVKINFWPKSIEKKVVKIRQNEGEQFLETIHSSHNLAEWSSRY